jgi:hypothetical protein
MQRLRAHNRRLMMIVMWKTERGIAAIERVECTRTTSASVWYMKRPFVIGRQDAEPVETKAAKHGDRVAFHDTWEDAHMNLMEHAAWVVQSKRRQLELANAHHGNVKGLRKPAEVAVG